MDAEVPVSHRLYLIRHGETVDNVAGLYAGVRDSALTNHGVQQATRLGAHLGKNGLSFTHIFSSDLQRAHKTAELIRAAQPRGDAKTVEATTQLAELREQDFGYLEGKSFQARQTHETKTGRESGENEPKLQDVESKQDMAKRADKFLDHHLLPLLADQDPRRQSRVVAVVAHGMILATLWRCILRRQPPQSVKFGSDIMLSSRPLALEHLGGWANTGYLELELAAARSPNHSTRHSRPQSPTTSSQPRTAQSAVRDEAQSPDVSAGDVSPILEPFEEPEKKQSRSAFTITIKTINNRDHLKGLKRTGGGVGSSKFDEGQRSLDSYFKRRKV